jgi:hypothetical protein
VAALAAVLSALIVESKPAGEDEVEDTELAEPALEAAA